MLFQTRMLFFFSPNKHKVITFKKSLSFLPQEKSTIKIINMTHSRFSEAVRQLCRRNRPKSLFRYFMSSACAHSKMVQKSHQAKTALFFVCVVSNMPFQNFGGKYQTVNLREMLTRHNQKVIIWLQKTNDSLKISVCVQGQKKAAYGFGMA